MLTTMAESTPRHFLSHLPWILTLPGCMRISRLAGGGLRPTRQKSTFCLVETVLHLNLKIDIVIDISLSIEPAEDLAA